MKKFNISTKREFVGKTGEQKTLWNNVGQLRVTDDDKIFIELFMYPNTTFYAFPVKEKEDKPLSF